MFKIVFESWINRVKVNLDLFDDVFMIIEFFIF